ncbi:S8 family serine peptidase [Haladaptatus pallidirubidus]|uniref:S8 family serine peptidase n=1 Tax=Haladaptatus pallidirubidus TaxID=1008152 RepID=UPI0035E69B82
MQEQKSEINYLSDEDTQQRTGENTQYGSTTDRATLGLDITRRSLLKTTGAVGAAGLLGATTPVTAAETLTIDSMLDTSGSLQQALVVFESNAAVDHLRHLDLEKGYYKFNVLPIGYTLLTGDQIATVAGWSDVRYVEANHGIELLNDDARDVTGVDTIQDEYYYTGESVHVVVIDSGVDGDHPDLKENLQGHYRFVDPLDAESMWMDVGSADTASGGHGTHVTGSIAGNGSASDGRYRGMAPDADVSVYSTDAAAALLNVVGAYDDMLDKQRAGKHDVQLVNNSFGANIGGDYNPNGALETATWRAAELGILPVFAAGNSGPDTNTFSNYAAGPHLLAAAATDDDMNVTNFSSRGRSPDYSGQGRVPIGTARQLTGTSLISTRAITTTSQKLGTSAVRERSGRAQRTRPLESRQVRAPTRSGRFRRMQATLREQFRGHRRGGHRCLSPRRGERRSGRR